MNYAKRGRKRRRITSKPRRDVAKKQAARKYAVPPSLTYRGIGMPDRFTTSLKYTMVLDRDVSSASYLEYNFVANGMYDPDITGVGHQPAFFDQLMAFYDHYTVNSSMIKVTPIPDASDSKVPSLYSLMLVDGTGRGGTLFTGGAEEAVIEARETQDWQIVNTPQQINNHKDTSIRAYFNGKQFFGSQYYHGDSQFKGTDAANPTERAFFTLMNMSINGNDPGDCTFLVEMWFNATFHEPKNCGQS